MGRKPTALEKQLAQAIDEGFDVRRKGADGKSFSQRDGAAKAAILRTFLKNAKKSEKKSGALGKSVAREASSSVVRDPGTRLEWCPLVSKWTHLDHTKAFQSISLVATTPRDRVHTLVVSFKVAGSVSLSEPAASVTPVFLKNVDGTKLKEAAVESDFPQMVIKTDSGDGSSYVLEFAETYTTTRIGEKLGLVISTSNTTVGTEWLYYKAWIRAEIDAAATPNLEKAFVSQCALPA